MDTQQAKDIIMGMMTAKSNEIKALQMAIDVLESKLQTELIALNLSQIENQTLKQEKIVLQEEKRVLQEENAVLKENGGDIPIDIRPL